MGLSAHALYALICFTLELSKLVGSSIQFERFSRKDLRAARRTTDSSTSVLMNKPGRAHAGEQIHFPHLANGRDMGTDIGGWVRVLTPVHSSLKLPFCILLTSILSDFSPDSLHTYQEKSL